jgi:hypothetical protein
LTHVSNFPPEIVHKIKTLWRSQFC